MSNILQYKQLVNALKEASSRENISSGTLHQLAKELDNFSKELKKQHLEELDVTEEQYKLIHIVLECLRNSCIACARNQSLLIETTAVETTLEIMQDDYFTRCTGDIAQITKIKRLSLQFLGNLIAGNDACQDALRERIFPDIALKLLKTVPETLTDIVCMIIYNVVHRRPKIWDSKEAMVLLPTVISVVSTSDSEWGLLIVEHVLKEGKFSDIYNHLGSYHQQRLVLLDVFQAYLNDGNCPIPESTIIFLSDVYKESTTVLQSISVADEEKMQEVDDICRHINLNQMLLRILCSASSAQKYKRIAEDQSLLDSVVNRLLDLSIYSKNTRDSKPTDFIQWNDMMGLKRDLVRLIGNLCYNNKKNQDRVRELGGILAILDNCRIDDQNPYIGQWAVLAIRNLCDNNLENQRLISNIEQQGKIDHSSYKDLGIDLSAVDRRIRISSKKNET